MEALLFFVVAFFYFLPAINAGGRRHKDFGGIMVVNLFLGWTLIGWVWALAWSASGAPAVAAQATAPPLPPRPAVSAAAELERLAALREKGALSEEEFAAAKRKLIA